MPWEIYIEKNVDMISGFNVGFKVYNNLCSILQNVQIAVRNKVGRQKQHKENKGISKEKNRCKK
jgi:hypothetical protein